MRKSSYSAAIAAIGATLLPAIARAAEEGGAAQAQGSWLVLAFFTINFALFVMILLRYALPLARTFFRDRAAGIRSDLDRLGTALREAEQYHSRATQKLAAIEQELGQLRKDFEAETAFQVDRIRETARVAAERVRRDAVLTSNAVSDNATYTLRAQLAATATSLARELIARSFEARDQRRLIDEFSGKLEREAPAR